MNELYHHGIKGQKWGVRRYQNADGTLTSLGQRRYGNLSGSDRDKAINLAVTKDYASSKMAAKGGSEIAGHARNVSSSVRSMRKQRSSDRMDLSNMTDRELQTRINRMNMERNYKSLMSENVGKGHAYAENILSIAGSVLATTASALSIAIAIRQLKNG